MGIEVCRYYATNTHRNGVVEVGRSYFCPNQGDLI